MRGDLVLERVGVRLSGRHVVENVSASLPAGSMTALVGPNGAGKTSLVRALVGLLPYEGRANLAGNDLARLTPRERARRIAYLPQGHEAHWPLPARDIVALGRIPHGAADPDTLSAADHDAVARAMETTDTRHLGERPVTALSGGERARIALARVFAVEAPVILADEPVAALDPRHQLDVMHGLRAQADAGGLVIVVTHDLGLAARFADRVLVLAEGRPAAFAPPAEALGEAVLRSVFRVEAYRAEHRGQPVIVPWS